MKRAASFLMAAFLLGGAVMLSAQSSVANAAERNPGKHWKKGYRHRHGRHHRHRMESNMKSAPKAKPTPK